MTIDITKRQLLNLLAEEWESNGPPGMVDTPVIAKRLCIDAEIVKQIIRSLYGTGVIDTNMGEQYAMLTQKGFAIAKPNDPTTPKTGDTNINISAPVSQSAIAVNNSSASISLNDSEFLKSLAEKISKSDQIKPEDKPKLLESVKNLAKHPIVAGIISSLVGLSFTS